MANLLNLCRVTTSTVGTGSTIAIGAAVSGYLTPALAGAVNATVYDYAIKDGAASEIGTITYSTTGPQFTGRTVTKSTNANAAINLSGTAEIAISVRAETLNDASLFTTGTLPDARLSNTITAGSAGSSTAIPVLTFDAHGRLTAVSTAAPAATGRFISRQTLYSTNSSLAPPAGATSCIFRMQAAGGGSSGKPAGSCCGIFPNKPGGGGAYLEGYIATLVGNLNFTLGAAGAAGASGSNNGGNASNSTLVHNGNTWTAPGGVGGTTTTPGPASSAPTVVNTASDWGVKGGTALMANVNSQGPSDTSGPSVRGMAAVRGSGSANLYGSGGPGVTSTPASAGIAGAVGMLEVEWYT